MEIVYDGNLTDNQPQANLRMADLRRWMYLHNVTFIEMGRHMGGITRTAVHLALRKARIPVRHHKALRAAYPDLPVELLPVPMDLPPGPKPAGLEFQEAAV